MEKVLLNGMPVSNGTGVGKLYTFEYTNIEINKGKIKESLINEEIIRLEVAIDKTLIEICDLSNDLRQRLEAEDNLIFEAYKTILEDKYFISEIKDLIHVKKIFAENAVDMCINSYVNVIEISDNDYAKQSIIDIKEIGSRIIRNIMGGKTVKHHLDDIDSKCIIGIKCLTPWLAAALGKRNVTGVVAEEGAAYFSHAAIILRGLGVPLMNNVPYDLITKSNNRSAILDCNNGILIINPDKKEISEYKELYKSKMFGLGAFFRKRNTHAETVDNKRIAIMANIGNFDECDIAVRNLSDGIGLVRTEVLFINSKEMPDDKKQLAAYSKIVKKIRPEPVVIRTLDAGHDKIFSGFTSKMSIKKEGLRGIRFSLSQKEIFIQQISAIVHSALLGEVGIMFPMVNSADDILKAKEIISNIINGMDEKSRTKVNLRIGAVIENRTGIENIESILDEVDFISIGTNDLLQEMQGASRKHLSESDKLYLNPDFLMAVKYCCMKSHDKGKPVSVCGEIAADISAAILLIGMGVDGLSVHPAKVTALKDIIRKISYKDSKEVLEAALQKLDEHQVSEMMDEWLKKHF
ncbi:MAG TPA: phosphoenolpyruvate--protein phosphotransferase [Pseudobacteroides sp.]|uniref:phosphoenolpyruvate--protein phosphotransferase n=1 Tax=Pseudobacteroides sp. TaxID=1968840 RepID=UPI002F93030E